MKAETTKAGKRLDSFERAQLELKLFELDLHDN